MTEEQHSKGARPHTRSKPNSALVLASASPQRLALLARLGVRPCKVLASAVCEKPLKNEPPRRLVVRLALDKATAARARLAQEGENLSQMLCLLAADTIVVCRRRVLGKPHDREQAREFLQTISGRRHQVWTSVLVCNAERSNSRISLTRVGCKRLTEREIEDYLDLEEWRESAGAYRIQGAAEGFVRSLNGSHSAVAGLPLFETRQLLLSYKVL